MIAKELRDGWWKAAIGIALFALVLDSLFTYETILQEASSPSNVWNDGSPAPEEFGMPTDPVEYALSEMWFAFGLNGAWIMGILATFFGFNLISGEASRGTIFLLLAKPIDRTRILLIKYITGAGTLLIVAVVGALGLIFFAGLKEYPLNALSVVGLTLSTTLLWLGSLSVLGLATLASVVFRDVVASAIATPLCLAFIFFFPVFLPESFVSYVLQIPDGTGPPEASAQAFEKLSLPAYWIDEKLFMGESFAATNFLVCAIFASLPILAAIWLFKRKAY